MSLYPSYFFFVPLLYNRHQYYSDNYQYYYSLQFGKHKLRLNAFSPLILATWKRWDCGCHILKWCIWLDTKLTKIVKLLYTMILNMQSWRFKLRYVNTREQVGQHQRVYQELCEKIKVRVLSVSEQGVANQGRYCIGGIFCNWLTLDLPEL